MLPSKSAKQLCPAPAPTSITSGRDVCVTSSASGEDAMPDVSTGVGAGRFAVPPVPSRPPAPSPQQYAFASIVTPQLPSPPTVSDISISPPSTGAGSDGSDGDDPSCPDELSPQQYASPSSLSPQACARPTSTDRNPPGTAVTATGEEDGVPEAPPPSPSWPAASEPQHQAVPFSRTAQVLSSPAAICATSVRPGTGCGSSRYPPTTPMPS